MNKNIKVTFVMMAYNEERFIEKAVRSVLDQTVKEVAICVRNNGSTDRTGEILERLSREDDRLYVVYNKKNGLTEEGETFYGKGWWPLPEELTGEYISILDADDHLEPNFVEVLYAAAKEHDADITAGGSFLLYKGERVSSRIPAPLVTDSLHDLEPVFPNIYTCFLTWWGKLFKTEIFLEEYEAAWRIYPPMNWVMDTLVMIGYLGKCRKLVTVSQPLYNYLLRKDSTNNKRKMDSGVLWAAYVLFHNAGNFLREQDIATEGNQNFLELSHWSYLMYSVKLLRNNDLVPPEEKLVQLKTVLNDSIVRRYLSRMFEKIYGTLEPYLTEIEGQAGEDASIYESYIMRLKCFVDSLREDDASPLLYPLLLGVLFDPENRNWFGMNFMELPIRGGSAGIIRLLEKKEEAWMCWSENPSFFLNVFCNKWDCTPEVKQAEQDIAKYWNVGQYEECSILVEEVSRAANFSRNAMYYRILLWEKFQQHGMAMLLAYTARIIFRDDKEMVKMCNDLINRAEASGK